jgi:hypothetical protein
MTRRSLLFGPVFLQRRGQRVIVLMVDGLGQDYIAASPMPVLTGWQKRGLGKIVDGVMPSVTNANNASICCGVWPEHHGITANFYLDETTGREEYMEQANLVLAPTLFERAAARGVSSALLSSKKKTITLLPRGATIVMSAEIPEPHWSSGWGMRLTFIAPKSIIGCSKQPCGSSAIVRISACCTSTPPITRCICGLPRMALRGVILPGWIRF